MNLSFQFESFSDFMTMSGHGPYVWSVYLITTVVLVVLLLGPLQAKTRFLAEQQRRQRLQERGEVAATFTE